MTVWSPPPDVYSLVKNTVHIWRVNLDQLLVNRDDFRTSLSTDEIQRAARFHFEKDRYNFMTRRAALRQLLSSYLNCEPEDVAFEYNTYGKPSLSNKFFETFDFSLSKSGKWVLFAFANEFQVGIDVEKIIANIDWMRLAQRFFSRGEQLQLFALQSEKQLQAFFSFWTRKEAFVKCHGVGLSLPLDQFSVSINPGDPPRLISMDAKVNDVQNWTIKDISLGSDYCAALAASTLDPRIKFFEMKKL